MKQEDELNIDLYINSMAQVKLYYFEDEIYGQILKHSKDFILINEIKDWHYDGYMIFPKQNISKIEYGELEKFRQKILTPLDYQILGNDIDWLNINSFQTIFLSLKNTYNTICIEGADNDVNQFILGEISEYDTYNLFINKLNIYAELDLKEIEIPIKDITCITFKDEYSRKLFEYNKKKFKK